MIILTSLISSKIPSKQAKLLLNWAALDAVQEILTLLLYFRRNMDDIGVRQEAIQGKECDVVIQHSIRPIG